MYLSIGQLALRDFPEENKVRLGRKFKFLAFGVREEEYQCDEFALWGMKWVVKPGHWTNGGTCLEVENLETGVGISLLQAGNGDYANWQRSPSVLLWHEGDFQKMIDENRSRLGKRDSTGCFRSVLVGGSDQ